MKKVLIIILILLLTGYAGISYKLSDQILSPHSSMERTEGRIQQIWGSTLSNELRDLPQPSDINFTTADGVALRGKYFAQEDSASCLMILCHGWSSNWAGMLKYAHVLEDCHCDLLLYDHRAHGESDGDYPTGGIKESEDLLQLTAYISTEKGWSRDQIAWLGASWGAATVLQAADDPDDVAFVIADSPFQDWYSAIFERADRQYGLAARILSTGVMQMVNLRADIDYAQASTIGAMSDITEPVLLIHSKYDEATDSQQSVRLAQFLNDKSEFHHLDWGGGHTADVRINRDRYQSMINEFITNLSNPHFTIR